MDLGGFGLDLGGLAPKPGPRGFEYSQRAPVGLCRSKPSRNSLASSFLLLKPSCEGPEAWLLSWQGELRANWHSDIVMILC